MKSRKNTYNNTNRQIKAEETKLSIIKALGKLWTQYSINEITLDMIAEEANVTKRTILRKFGSKEGLLTESLRYDPAEIAAKRNQAKPGDIDDILKTLLTNYENMGDAAMRTIKLESELEVARQIGDRGRKLHRDWCKKVFAPFLPSSKSPDFEIQLTSFISVTEIYLWKLMRKDLKLSKKKTCAVFKNMLEGVIYKSSKNI